MTESRSSYGTLPIGADPRHVDDGGTYVWIPLEQYKAMEGKIAALEKELAATYDRIDTMGYWLVSRTATEDKIGLRLHATRQMYRRLLEQRDRYDSSHTNKSLIAFVFGDMAKRIKYLRAENARLRAEVARLSDPWISVEERLPEPVDEQKTAAVLVTDGTTVFTACYLYHSRGFWYSNQRRRCVKITHWMPLPKLPEVKHV